MRGRRALDDLDRDIRDHIEREIQENIERGLSPEEARRHAMLTFGSVALAKEDARAVWVWIWLEQLLQDVRYALRTLRRNPGFAAAAVLTLALGIGANATMFSAVNAILLRPLPYKDSARLVHIIENIPAAESFSGAPERTQTMDAEAFTEWRARARTLSHMAFQVSTSMTLTGRGDTVRLSGVQVSSPLLPMLQVAPLLGRVFTANEETPGADKVVVLGYGAWQRHFDGDPGIVGRVVSLNDVGYAVVGVMPRDFAFPDARSDFWVPLALASAPGGFRRFAVVARLEDGVTVDAAAAEAAAFARELLGVPPPDEPAGQSGPPRFEIVSWKDELVAPIRPALIVFVVAVTFVLLIACVNVANLFLARAAIRQREIAVRMALGAGRRRVLRQLLTESLTLTLLGGLAGCVLAVGGSRLLSTLGQGLARLDLTRVAAGGNTIPRLNEVSVDASVLLYALVITIATGVLFGLSPLRRLWRIDHALGSAAQAGSRPLNGRRPSAPRWLIVAQVALTMVLLLGAGLLIRSFANLAGVDAGYDPTNVLTFQAPRPQLPWSLENYPANLRAQQRQLETAEEIVKRLRAIDGIQAAAVSSALPMVQGGYLLAVKSRADAPDRAIPRGKVLLVGRDYFAVMRIRVTAGRGFTDSDRLKQRATFVINHSLARAYFGDANPIGHSLYLWGNFAGDIVGVVDDIRQSSLDTAPEPQLFMTPFRTREYLPVLSDGLYFAVRTETPAAAIVPQIRSIVRQADAGAPLGNIATMDQIVSNSVTTPRSYAVLSGLFALVALALAGIGIYGVLTYLAVQRTQEIGVRMALGAQRGEVLALVVRQGLVVTVPGVALGVVGGVAVTRYLETMLFGLTPLDVTTFVLAPVVFAIVAACACYLPARRATRVDPLVALRYE